MKTEHLLVKDTTDEIPWSRVHWAWNMYGSSKKWAYEGDEPDEFTSGSSNKGHMRGQI